MLRMKNTKPSCTWCFHRLCRNSSCYCGGCVLRFWVHLTTLKSQDYLVRYITAATQIGHCQSHQMIATLHSHLSLTLSHCLTIWLCMNRWKDYHAIQSHATQPSRIVEISSKSCTQAIRILFYAILRSLCNIPNGNYGSTATTSSETTQTSLDHSTVTVQRFAGTGVLSWYSFPQPTN